MRRTAIVSLYSVVVFFALKCQGSIITAPCTQGVNNCQYEDRGFYCCVPEGESYQAEAVSNPTVVMVGGDPWVHCAPLVKYNWITHQCDISTNKNCGGIAVSQDCN